MAINKEDKRFVGGMDTDSDPRNIKPGDYISALNLRSGDVNPSSNGSNQNIKATVGIGGVPGAIELNKCIGSVNDPVNDDTYSFIWSSSGNHIIYKTDQVTKIQTQVIFDNYFQTPVPLWSALGIYVGGDLVRRGTTPETYFECAYNYDTSYTGNISILNTYLWEQVGDYLDFKEDQIIQADIIIKDDDVFIFWVDSFDEEGNERCRTINITRQLNTPGIEGGYPIPMRKEYLDMAPEAPMGRPEFAGVYNSAVQANRISGNLFQFKYRFINQDNQPSAWSPHSSIGGPITSSAYKGVASANQLNITVGRPDNKNFSIVKEIEVAVRTLANTRGDWGIAKTIETTDLVFTYLPANAWGITLGAEGYPSNYTFSWINDINTPLSLNEQDYDYSYVPQNAKSISILNDNRVLLANTTLGYDDTGGTPDISLSEISLGRPNIFNLESPPIRTFKKGAKYEVGIRYSDGKSRVTTVITDADSSININWPSSSAILPVNPASIQIEVGHVPPIWAKTWQPVVRPASNMAYEFDTPDFIQIMQHTNTFITDPNLDDTYGALQYQIVTRGAMQVWQFDRKESLNYTYSWTKGDRVREYLLANQGPAPYRDAEAVAPFVATGELSVITLGITGIVPGSAYEIYSTNSTENKLWYEMGDSLKCGYDINGDWSHYALNNRPFPGFARDQIVSTSVSAVYQITDADCWLSMVKFNESGPNSSNQIYPPTETSGRFSNNISYFLQQPYFDYGFSSKNNDRGRVNIQSDSYGRYNTTNRISFSQPVVQGTNRNDYSLMYPLDYYDNKTQFGAIEKVHQLGDKLYIFQVDKVSSRMVARSIINTPSGSGLIGASGDILSIPEYFNENYGISNNPESFSTYSGLIFWSDTQRGSVLMINEGRIIDISNIGMKFFFDNSFISSYSYTSNRILGGYDSEFSEYLISMSFEYKISTNVGFPPVYSSSNGGTFTFNYLPAATGSSITQSMYDAGGAADLPEYFLKSFNLYYIDDFGRRQTKEILYDNNITKDTVNGTYIVSIGIITNIHPTTPDFYWTLNAKSTLGFNSQRARWVSMYSFHPEMFGLAATNLLSYKNGGLYAHNLSQNNQLYNNFYLFFYPTSIEVAFNLTAGQNSVYNTIGINGDQPWNLDIRNLKGQKTEANIFDSEKLEGFYWYDIFRDINTPTTTTLTNPLMQGDILIDDNLIVKMSQYQTNVISVTITNGGSGYISVPTVTIIGSGAGTQGYIQPEGYAVLDGGVVTGVVMTNPGFTLTTTIIFSSVTFSGGSPTVNATGTTNNSNGLVSMYNVNGTFGISNTKTL
tara:strand:+ start:2827 stop:6732 length:3906 start_codon:yes stop_codon:yes gene_type:complete